jgi:DNA-binding GntR family transcriptional regulator
VKELESLGSLTSQAHKVLRAAIISGELAPGRLYSVYELAAVLGVSRTPVREALIRLASESMVRFERNRGVRILQTTAHDLEEVFELRLLLEVPATRRAATQMDATALAALRRSYQAMCRAAESGDEAGLLKYDRRFHDALLRASGNDRLAAQVGSLRDMVLTRGLCTAGASRSLADIAEEHAGVLAHVEARDPDSAAAAMRAHLVHTARLLIQQEFGLDGSRFVDWERDVTSATSEPALRDAAG